MNRPLPQAFTLLVLTCSLVATAVAQRKALDRLPQDAEAITLALPGDADPYEAIELAGKGRVRAVACANGELWLVRDEVLVMAAGDRKVQRQLPVPKGLLGLTADDRFFYVLQKHAIVVVDPRAAREVRRVELPDHSGQDPVAIGAHGDELFVAWPDGMDAVHKRTSKLRECTLPSPSLRWLASDGQSLWGGGPHGFARVETSSGKTRMQRGLRERFQHSLATFVGERMLLVASRAAAGKPVAAALVDPEKTGPHEQLRVSLRRGKQGLQYQVGPKPVATSKRAASELQRIRKSPFCMVPGPAGKPVPMPVLLVAYPGVKVRELAAAWDLVTAAGFGDVNCMSYNAKGGPPPPPPPGTKR